VKAGVDRPAEGLQDRMVDDLVEWLTGVAGLVLADPVVDDDLSWTLKPMTVRYRRHE